MKSFLISLYVLFVLLSFFEGYNIAGIILSVSGCVFVLLIPLYRNFKIKSLQKSILDSQAHLVDINKAPQYIFAVLPGIDRVTSKRIVWLRRRYGNFSSVEDFFEKVKIDLQYKDELKNILYVN